jgi:hypothetical protein
MNKEKLKERYLGSAKSYSSLEKKEEKILIIISFLRFITFFGGLILIWTGFLNNIASGIILIGLITILFLYLLKLFSIHSGRKVFLGNLVSINQNEANALSGDLSAFESGSSFADIRHDFSFDVDLFGASSLFQFINRTVTEYGRNILASWLSDPFTLSDELLPRQETIRELALKDKWRQEFMAAGMNTPLEKI